MSAYHYFDGVTNRWHLTSGGIRLSVNQSNGYVGIGDSSPDFPLDMASGAHCSTGGVWTNASSRDWKQDFEIVDPEEVLMSLVRLPITEWSYSSEQGIRHIGPVADDFMQAFGLGHDEQTIGTVDADGIALAAIQGLHMKLQERDDRIAERQSRIERLEQIIRDQSVQP